MTCTIFQFLCRRVTDHRWRKLTAYSVGIEPVEYHYTCRVCRKHFWNYDCKNAELQKLIQKVSDREVKNCDNTKVIDLQVKKGGLVVNRQGWKRKASWFFVGVLIGFALLLLKRW